LEGAERREQRLHARVAEAKRGCSEVVRIARGEDDALPRGGGEGAGTRLKLGVEQALVDVVADRTSACQVAAVTSRPMPKS